MSIVLPYEKAFILGNGFDIANGFNTRYSDFIKSDLFRSILNSNKLAQHIYKKYKEANWVDVEIEIGIYSFNLEKSYKGRAFEEETNVFKNDYNELTEKLYHYIDEIRSGKTVPVMEKLYNKWKCSICGNIPQRALFVSFNYLRWDFMELHDKLSKDSFVGESPQFIHGLTKYDENATPNIVLGVDEKSVRSKHHPFIVKAFNSNTQDKIFFSSIDEAKEITIFGCSIGDTDRRYFEYMFSRAKRKTFSIYGFGEDEICQIRSNISRIIPDFTAFERDNTVQYLDSSQL